VMHFLEAGGGEDAVLLLHGIPQSSHCWRRIIPSLASHYRVIAPDLRGLGDTSRPHSGYDKKTVAADLAQLLSTHLGIRRFFLVGHDWGGPVAYALTVRDPAAVRGLAILDVTIPGDGAEMSQGGRRWHHPFFRTPDLPEALMHGREHIYLNWLFDNYGRRQNVLEPQERAEYLRTYCAPGGLRAMLAYYRAVAQDAADNERALTQAGKLSVPVLALGGDSSFGRGMETLESMRRMARNVTGGVIPNCGHWVTEEAPEFVAQALLTFFRDQGDA
ncbi:MAG: alpha/beta fold hydrolase, partial [Quisquiliibacterium sp.]